MATAKKSTRATRTKAETATAFEDVRAGVESQDMVPESERALRAGKEARLRGAAEGFTLETAVQVLTSAGLGMSRALTDLTNRLQETAKQVEELTEVKALLAKDIEELHGKEVAASAIEDMVADFDERKEKLQIDFAAFSKQIDLTKADLRAAWEREQSEHQRQVQERNQTIAQERVRENDQYGYKTMQERARAEQDFKNRMADAQRANELKQADLERGWKEREVVLATKEEELKALQARVAGIQGEIDSAVKREVAIATNSLNRDSKHQVEMLVNSQAAKEQVLNAKIEGLTTQLVSANKTIADLTAQLVAANEKVAKIAADALTAASGRQALAEVQGMLQTQGSNGAQRKA